jgi:hypothetical protein
MIKFNQCRQAPGKTQVQKEMGGKEYTSPPTSIEKASIVMREACLQLANIHQAQLPAIH